MPVDIDAAVIGNRRLSPDYNVLSLDAPGIGAAVRPGQFVMIQTARGLDPLLRRPFSIFEVLHDPAGRATGISIFNKRVGAGTQLLFEIGEILSLQFALPNGHTIKASGKVVRVASRSTHRPRRG